MALTDILAGAVTIGRSLIRPTKAVDVVAIIGPGFSPLFSPARPMTADVREGAALMEHPIETGAIIADHIVFDPIEITFPVIIVGELEYRNTYALMKAAFTAGTLLTIVTRTGSYANMVITDMPHEERPDAFNAIGMRLKFREAKFVQPKTGALSDTADPKQSSTVARGAQQTTAANASQSSAASKAYSQSGAAAAPGPQGSTLHQWYNGL